jgi:hypothetical protein
MKPDLVRQPDVSSNGRHGPVAGKLNFDYLPRVPAQHFNLYFYAATLFTIMQAIDVVGDLDAAFEQFPFLTEYFNELAVNGLDGISFGDAPALWFAALRDWEASASGHLPLRALREHADFNELTLTLLLVVGLLEEDRRFGAVFQALYQHTVPTFGLLVTWYSVLGDVRAMLNQLLELRLLQVTNPTAPRPEWELQPDPLIWDALRGQPPAVNWAITRPLNTLIQPGEWVGSETTQELFTTLPAWLAERPGRAVLVRGPQHNGRRTFLGIIARHLGHGVLEVPDPTEHWGQIALLATALNLMPVLTLTATVGETIHIPRLKGYRGPVGLTMGMTGGVSGDGVAEIYTVTLPMPDVALRRACWSQITPRVRHVDAISTRLRLPTGNIFRLACLSESQAALKGHTALTSADIQQANRMLNHQALDGLAIAVNVSGDWTQFAARAETFAELKTLESRCRQRENIRQHVNPAFSRHLNGGVRALFTGPSGTGKTLAACQLASVLGLDLYRVDLSSVVNKYIGETEKNLERIFAAAEALNVILLLDEGDALLTQRTAVQSSNDRYANLETNFLLQRLEVFDGIVIVTTNAANRIDGAFQRRMDIVVEFHAPEAEERWSIWWMHLPVEHQIDEQFLRLAAARCALTGGQIRNAVLHASLLALEACEPLNTAHIEAAVEREYRKLGQIYPMRRD